MYACSEAAIARSIGIARATTVDQQSSDHLCRLAHALGDRCDDIVANVTSRVHRDAATFPHVVSAESLEIDHAAVRAVLTCACSTLAESGCVPGEVPSGFFEEATAAARNDLAWAILDRRYAITHEVLADAVVVELGCWNLKRKAHTLVLQLASRCLFKCFDFLVTAAGRVYETERKALLDQGRRRPAEMVNHVLCGIPVTDAELGYGTHQEQLGVVGRGYDPRAQIQRAARKLEAEVLVVPRPDGAVWAWLGRQHFGDQQRLRDAFQGNDEPTHLALGSVQTGRAGFVATHDQARLASSVAPRQLGSDRGGTTWYADVAIESMALADESRARTFVAYALAALAASDSSSIKLRETLRIYFQSGQNTALAARELKIAERTVRYRLRIAEERLGQRVTSQEVAVAIRLYAALEAEAHSRPWATTQSIQALAS